MKGGQTSMIPLGSLIRPSQWTTKYLLIWSIRKTQNPVQNIRRIGALLVPEMAHAGEHHRDARVIGGGDHLVVPH